MELYTKNSFLRTDRRGLRQRSSRREERVPFGQADFGFFKDFHRPYLPFLYCKLRSCTASCTCQACGHAKEKINKLDIIQQYPFFSRLVRSILSVPEMLFYCSLLVRDCYCGCDALCFIFITHCSIWNYRKD